MTSIIKVKSGLTRLFFGMKEFFEDNAIEGRIEFGVDAYFRKDNQGAGGAARVVIVPGRFDGSHSLTPRAYGFLGTKLGHAQTNPKELAHWTKPVTFCIWAAPAQDADPRDPVSQNEQTEYLFERTVEAARLTVMSDLVWKDILRKAPPQMGAFGEEIFVWADLKGPLFYLPTDVAFPTAVVSRGAVG